MNVYTFAYDNNYEPSIPVVEIGVLSGSDASEISLSALVDSGADASMLPVSVLQNAGARFLDEMIMRGVVGHAQAVSVYLVNIRIGSHIVPGVKAVAMDGTGEAILGRDVLNQLVVTLNGLAQVTEIAE